MEVINVENINDVIINIQSMGNVSRNFYIPDENLLEQTKEYIDLLVAFHKSNICDFTKTIDGWDEHEVEDTYRVRWLERSESPAILTENDLNFKSICQKVLAEKSFLEVEFSPKLSRYIGNYCKSIGINFKSLPEKGVFLLDTREKKESVYKRMESALNSGADYLDLDPADVGVQTVRVYATQINRFTNKKVQVSYYNDFIRVYFKEKKDAYYEAQAKKLFDTISRDLGQTEAILIFNDFIPQPTEKPYDDNLEIE